MTTEIAHNWQDVLIAFCAALPAVAAAVIGVRNGRKIDRHDEWERNGKPIETKSAPRKRSHKRAGGADGNTASDPDWYKAPDL